MLVGAGSVVKTLGVNAYILRSRARGETPGVPLVGPWPAASVWVARKLREGIRTRAIPDSRYVFDDAGTRLVATSDPDIFAAAVAYGPFSMANVLKVMINRIALLRRLSSSPNLREEIMTKGSCRDYQAGLRKFFRARANTPDHTEQGFPISTEARFACLTEALRNFGNKVVLVEPMCEDRSVSGACRMYPCRKCNEGLMMLPIITKMQQSLRDARRELRHVGGTVTALLQKKALEAMEWEVSGET